MLPHCRSRSHPQVRSNKPTTACVHHNAVTLIIALLPPHPPGALPSCRSGAEPAEHHRPSGGRLPLHLAWWTNQKLISTFVQRGCWLINYYWLWAWLRSAAKRHLKGQKTTNKNWAAVILFKFIKTKYIIFYEAVLKWVSEGEHIDWKRMKFSNFCSLETEFNYNTRQTG